jgi:hypothetical protein
VAPDIDLEIWSSEPQIQDGFEILAACAQHKQVTRARFWNALGPPHHGLYWQLRYDHDGEEWKIDAWSMSHSYTGPCGTHLVEPMQTILTPVARRAVLHLKELVVGDPELDVPSIQIYRAVLDHGIRTLEQLQAWLPENRLEGVVTDWMPSAKGQA